MKILNLKYKMHKLVNLVFYLIIFGIGFVLGFGTNKINFNNIISQFLFIDTVNAEELTCIETDNLFIKEDLKNRVINNGASVDITFHDNSIIIYSPIWYSGASYYIDLEPGTYTFSVDSITGGHNAIQLMKVVNDNGTEKEEWLGGIYGGTPREFVLTEKSRFHFRFYNTVDKSSFTTTYTNVVIKGQICTTETPGDNNENNENIGGDNNENENPDDDVKEDVEIEIITGGFYDFAQKIFGEVNEENKFIYDFITFGLVITCFTLFVLILGYILKKFIGG